MQTPSKVDTSALCAILHGGWPVSIQLLLTFLPSVVILTFLGSDVNQLAAGGMAISFQNIICMTWRHLGGALGPLVSQSIGAGNHVRCGKLLQRQMGLHSVMILVSGMLMLTSKLILAAFQQPQDVAALAAQFLWVRSIALPFWAIISALQDYLIAQKITKLPVLVSCTIQILTIAFCPASMSLFGFIGAPLAMTAAQTFHALLLFTLARRSVPKEAWPQWSPRIAFSGWGELLSIGVPNLVFVMSENMGWEMNLIFAGLLCEEATSCPDLDVFPILSNLLAISWLLGSGFYISGSNLLGSALGAGYNDTARQISHTILVLVACLALGIACGAYAARWHWPRLYTSDPDVIFLAGRIIPTVCIYIFASKLNNGALLAVLRNVGCLRIPAVITFVAFYIVGIPSGLYLAFWSPTRYRGVAGLWSGLAVAMSIAASCNLAYLLCCVDWNQAVAHAQSQATCSWMGKSCCTTQAPESPPKNCKLATMGNAMLGNGAIQEGGTSKTNNNMTAWLLNA